MFKYPSKNFCVCNIAPWVYNKHRNAVHAYWPLYDRVKLLYVIAVTSHHDRIFDAQLQSAWNAVLDNTLTATPLIGAWTNDLGQEFLDVSYAANYAGDQYTMVTKSYDHKPILKITSEGNIEFLDI